MSQQKTTSLIVRIRKLLTKLFLAIAILMVFYPIFLYLTQPAGLNIFGLEKPTEIVIDPFLDEWKNLRNIVYLFYLIALPFGIFLSFVEKNKKGVEKYFVNWIIGLLLATFSYAIAGLIIDIGFLFWYLSRGVKGEY